MTFMPGFTRFGSGVQEVQFTGFKGFNEVGPNGSK
jgi:hypothetical protein